MKYVKNMNSTFLLAMTVISVTQLFGMGIAGVSVCLGLAFFFIDKAIRKTPFSKSGLNIRAIGSTLKERKIWLWILLPTVLDALSIALSKLVLPEYIGHVLSRTEMFVSFDNVLFIIFQLALLALGEEIAWRAFFQQQINQYISFMPSLIICSVLFAIGHIASGNPIIVFYDIFFVFLNSIVYGIVFYKSKNAWISAISHFTANLFGIIILVLL